MNNIFAENPEFKSLEMRKKTRKDESSDEVKRCKNTHGFLLENFALLGERLQNLKPKQAGKKNCQQFCTFKYSYE